MRTFLSLTLLVAMVSAKPYMEDNNNLSLQESCDLVCNGASGSYCYSITGNYLKGPSVGRLCCLTKQIPNWHNLTVDYTPVLNTSIYDEILLWADKPEPRPITTLYLQCIRDCTLQATDINPVTHEQCMRYIEDQSICPQKRVCPSAIPFSH